MMQSKRVVFIDVFPPGSVSLQVIRHSLEGIFSTLLSHSTAVTFPGLYGLSSANPSKESLLHPDVALSKKNYFTSSDPHHDMSGGGCQGELDVLFAQLG